MNTAYFNNNVKEAIKASGVLKDINISSKRLKLCIVELQESMNFPFIGKHWPQGIRLSNCIDLTSNVFTWLNANLKNVNVRENLKTYIETQGKDINASLSLLRDYRKFCKENKIIAYI